ncbi:MAG TPA: tRNA (adenosine(37)-N6)-threonylcarbamoyltransferase complex ATPase subunit type 1 TsaE, partial [Desulfobacteria bacterium]|nr:tRNA (adenosine(37)-N6)-threonylcarbamoyltransferase complex ATPase subunit type 1 TsaE [Desulfobacteria bacterium]
MQLGYALGKVAQPGDVYCLLGELGAGKTALAQGIGRGLGINEQISSPTFTLINEYHGRLPFFHMDLYRISRLEEGEELGLTEYFGGQGLCVVEWPQVVAALIPADILQLDFSVKDTVRTIKLTGYGVRSREIIKEVTNIVGPKH